jgi:hypothetical protein
MLNRYEYSFYIDGLPPGPLLYCTQEKYSSLMNPPYVFILQQEGHTILAQTHIPPSSPPPTQLSQFK